MDKERARVIIVAILSGLAVVLAVVAATTHKGFEMLAPLLNALAGASGGQ
jgi:hypothetical protein